MISCSSCTCETFVCVHSWIFSVRMKLTTMVLHYVPLHVSMLFSFIAAICRFPLLLLLYTYYELEISRMLHVYRTNEWMNLINIHNKACFLPLSRKHTFLMKECLHWYSVNNIIFHWQTYNICYVNRLYTLEWWNVCLSVF